MRRFSYYISDLVCPCCGYMATVPRKRANQKQQGRIKTMWCPICGRKQDFVEQTKYGVLPPEWGAVDCRT